MLLAGAAAFRQSSIGGLRVAASVLSSEAYLYNDGLMVNASALFYSLAKFLEKGYILSSPKWTDFRQRTLVSLDKAVAACGGPNSPEGTARLAAILEKCLSDCDEVSELLGRFHVSAVEKARLKIAADFYARGASLGSACALAGADKSSALLYIGVTRLVDKYETIPVATRLKAAEMLFTPVTRADAK